MPSNNKRRKRRFRQLRLHVTDGNELILERVFKKSPRPAVPYEADPELFNQLPFYELSEFELAIALRPPFPVLRLPEELVLKILTNTVDIGYQRAQRPPSGKMYSVPLSLCAVCRAFRRLAYPLLFYYMGIKLSGEDISSGEAHDKLYRKLRTDGSIAEHCRELDISFRWEWPEGVDATTVGFPHFPNVNRLRVGGNFNNTFGTDGLGSRKSLWAFVQHILQHTSRVKELSIRNRWPCAEAVIGLPGALLFAIKHVPTLRSLRLYGIAKVGPDSAFVLPEELEGVATFTTLSITHCNAGPSALAELMKWPFGLESLTVYEIYWYPNRGYFHDFRSILYRHRETLRFLHIGNVPEAGPLDLSEFTSLESLHLFSRTMSHKWEPEELCNKILAAPRLRNLVWDFHQWDEQIGHCTAWEDFGPAEVEWLQRVAELAKQRNASLREIQIAFRLGECFELDPTKERSPWDWMEDARVGLERFNISLLIN
ncbi:hypothetical protein PSPO01_13394 [Paraphaeosphaeria sporulosa]